MVAEGSPYPSKRKRVGFKLLERGDGNIKMNNKKNMQIIYKKKNNNKKTRERQQ